MWQEYQDFNFGRVKFEHRVWSSEESLGWKYKIGSYDFICFRNLNPMYRQIYKTMGMDKNCLERRKKQTNKQNSSLSPDP